MGYYTRYTLTTDPPELLEDAQVELAAAAGGDVWDDRVKWYDHEDHAKSVSAKVPAILILDGDGEEAGDVWRKAFAGGEMIFEWRADTERPDVPDELAKRWRAANAAKQSAALREARAKRREELEAELAKLAEDA